MKLNKEFITSKTFLRLKPSKGYSRNQCSEAMQVMELWKDYITVKCKDGVLSKPYEHLEIIPESDYYKYKVFHVAPYFQNYLEN